MVFFFLGAGLCVFCLLAALPKSVACALRARSLAFVVWLLGVAVVVGVFGCVGFVVRFVEAVRLPRPGQRFNFSASLGAICLNFSAFLGAILVAGLCR